MAVRQEQFQTDGGNHGSLCVPPFICDAGYPTCTADAHPYGDGIDGILSPVF